MVILMNLGSLENLGLSPEFSKLPKMSKTMGYRAINFADFALLRASTSLLS